MSEMRLLRAAIYFNFFVALVLSALTACSYALFDYLVFRWYVVAAVFLGSMVLYTFHRLYKIDHIPAERLGERHRWVLRNAGKAKVFMVSCVFLLMLLLPNFDTDSIIWLVPAGILSLGYTIPLVPGEKNWWRFRDIPFAKPLIIALVVSYLTLAFPVFEQEGIMAVFQPDVMKAWSERLLFILAVTIPFEMRDLSGDRQAGLETVATEFGFRVSRQLILVVAMAWLALCAWRAFEAAFAWPLVAGPLVLLAALLPAVGFLHPQRGELFYVLVFEGMILLYAAVTAAMFLFHRLAWSQPPLL